MKTKYIKPSKNEYISNCNTYKLYEIKNQFETIKKQIGNTTYTEDHPIDSINIKGNFPNQITFEFGNFGHIHISGKQLIKFVEGINKVYENLQ